MSRFATGGGSRRTACSSSSRRSRARTAAAASPPRPELIARGFGDGAEGLLEELRGEAKEVLERLLIDDVTEIKLLQEHLHDALGGLIYDRTQRRPMILPVLVEI